MDWSVTELSAFIVACAGGLSLVIQSIQKSRCSDIDLCCVHCKRTPPTTEEQLEALEAQRHSRI